MKKNETLPSSTVRSFCRKRYGHEISAKTWQNWKEWAGCPPGRHQNFTIEQSAKLLAIAGLRSRQQFGALTWEGINKDAELTKTFVQSIIDKLNNDLVLGRDIPSFLEEYGIKVHRARLYDRIKFFSSKTAYDRRVVFELFS